MNIYIIIPIRKNSTFPFLYLGMISLTTINKSAPPIKPNKEKNICLDTGSIIANYTPIMVAHASKVTLTLLFFTLISGILIMVV